MKVTLELSKAITAASKGQKIIRPSYDQRKKACQEAEIALDVKLKGKITKLREKYKRELAKAEAVEAELEAFGVGTSPVRHDSIKDEEAFVKAGGILPTFPNSGGWKVEEVIAKLLAAKKQEEFDAILASYNIHWT